MDQPPDPEPRLSALEDRVDRVERETTAAQHDAAAARILAAGADHDNADLKVKVDALRKVLNAHAEQTAGGFAEIREEFAKVRVGFAETAAGQRVIVDLITRLLPEEDGDEE